MILNKSLSFNLKIKACIQIATALEYLHSVANVYHRDIKTENILVFSKNDKRETIHIKVCDFGISKKFVPRL